jgi:hypothetical protein
MVSRGDLTLFQRLVKTMSPSTRRIDIKFAGYFLLVIGFIHFIAVFRNFSIDLITVQSLQKSTFSFFIGIIWVTMGIFLLTTKLKTSKDIFLSNIFVPLIIVELILSSVRDQLTYGYSQKFYWSAAVNFLLGIVIIFYRLELQRREKKSRVSS